VGAGLEDQRSRNLNNLQSSKWVRHGNGLYAQCFNFAVAADG
jgi:hypothetical protein